MRPDRRSPLEPWRPFLTGVVVGLALLAALAATMA
jgi:hypothetical protein